MPQDYTQFYQSYNAYLRNPDQFGQDEIDKLRTQAQRYNIQFTDLSPESTVGSVAGNFWHGLVQGFTTLPVGDKPRNDVEGIAHSLGHLIGFIGGVPGLGTAASLTTKTLIKGGGVLAGRGIAKKAVTKASIEKATIFAEKYVKSVPMGIAEYTMNKVGKTEIAKTLGDFLGHDVLRQAVRHGAHLGVASMVSGAATAIKEEDLLPALGSILEQGAMGFIAGGTFAGIGNIKIPGIKAMTTGDKILKGFAGATVMTIPGALQGATTPENLYNFLIGGYFGASTKPAKVEKAWRFLKTLPADQRAAYETNKDFSNLPKDEQKNVIKVANDFYKPKQAHRSMFDIFKGMGWTTKAIPPASTERLVTVKAGKYRGKSGTTIEDIEGKRTVQIRLEDDTITRLNRKQLIYKDDLLPLEEVEKIRTPDIESKIQEEINALHDFDGSEIITSRPAESLLKKMLGKETFSDEEYVGHLRNLNERISESLEKGSSWKKTKELLLETAQDIRSNLGVKNKEPFVDSDLGQFRQYFIKYNNSINIPRYAFDTETGKFVEQTNFDAKGNRIDTREPVKLINEIAVADGIVTDTKDAYFTVKKVLRKNNRGKKEQVDLSTDIFKSKEYRNMINSALDMGYYPYSGKSDSDVLIFMKLNHGNLAAELTRIKTALKKTDPQLLADFNILRTQGLSKTGLGVEGQVLVDRIISGGQKGVDLIGLNVGKDLKITTGGTAPPEWISGRKKEQKLLEGFGLTEGEPDPSTYKKRTIKNIKDADGTVLFGKDRGGTRLTLRMAKELNKPWIMNPTGKELQQWLIRNDIKTLNVAGNQKILNPKTVEDVLRKGLSRDPLEISETAREMYDKMFVSNIKWWEAQNRLPIETIIANSGKEKTGKAFIGDVIDFNKRQQPLFSSYYRLTRDTFTEDFNYVLINDFVNSKDPNIKKMKLGIQSTDGGVIVRDDVLAAILSDMGLPEGGGFAKPFFNSPGHDGLMIGKLALHAAGKAQSKSMKAKDIHFLIPESVAKQTGMRELVDYNYVQKLPEKEAKRRLSIQAAKELNVLAQIEGLSYEPAKIAKAPDRIGDISIPEKLRRKGLGTRFFKAIKKQRLAKGRKKIDIQVNADDPKALKFWTKMGFKKVGKAVKHLDEGVTIQDMTYDLAPDIKKMGSLVGEQVEFSKKGQKLEATDVKDNYTHQMKPEDVLVSFSTYDKGGEKFAEKQRVYKGIHDVLISASINENHPDIYSEMQEWLGGHIKGKKVAGRYVSNDQLKEYIRKGELDEESLKVIMRNFDDLGIKAVNDAMKNESDAGVAFREKARIKMIREAEEGQEDNIIELLRDGVGRNSIEKQSAAAKYLEVSDGSDAITLMKGPSDFTDRAINSYFIKRILQPKVGNSSKGIMRLKDGELLSRTDPEGNTSRIRTEDDIFFLDDGFKDFPMMGINANGQEAKMTLGEQWGLFRKTKRGVPVRQQMREALEAVVVRTPLDNVSGLANLKFEGFTGRSGRGILLADKVMERLGGADLDIDTAAFYFNVFPKGLKEISKVYKNELKEIQKYADKKYGGLEKLGKDFFTIPSKNKKQTSPMATFDPYSRMFVANTIGNAANKMRGIAVNNRFYIRWLYSQARMNNGTLVDKVQIGQNKGTVFKFIARASEKDLRAKSVSAINVSVDVAKYGALVSPNRFKAVLMDAGFKEIQIWTPDKQKTVIRGIDAMERFFSQPLDILSKDKKNVFSISMYSSVFQKIANANQKFFGWNYTEGRAWTKAERQEAALEHPSIDHSHLKYVADELSQLDYTDSFFNRFGRNINAFDSFMGKVESAIRKNPELLRFVPLHEAGKDKGKPVFTKAYRQGIVKKMNVWARWYFGKGRYNISTERGKKAVAYDDNAWKLFTSQLGDVGPKGNQKKYLDSLRGVQRWQRLRYINNEVSKINDFLSNDLYAYASLKTLNDIGDLYNIPFDMNPTSLSFSKRLIQYASGIKTNYKKAYKEASTKLDASPGATALDAVARDLAEVKVIMRTVTDEYNKVKPTNKPEVTYEGVNAFLEASMLGSIGNTKDLNAYRFAPLFASKGVLRIFSNNYQSIFKYAGDRPSTKQVTDWFLNNPVSQEAEQVDSNIRFMDRLDLSFPKEIADIKLDPKMKEATDEIINRMKRYPYDKWDPESFVQMIRGMFRVGQISDMTAQDIEGLRNAFRSWQKGRGWFRWFSRGGGKDILRKMSLGILDGKEVSKGKLKVGIGHWFKTSETVGSDHLLNDLKLIDRRMPVTTTSEGKLERVYADAKVPMSHFDKMVEHTSKMFDLPNQIRSTDEEALQEAISPYRVIKTVNGKDEAIMIARVAIKEMEFEGAIRERDRARNEGFSEERIKSIQRNVDATGGRRAQDQEALDKVLATEYQLGNKILSGREVLDRMKGDLEPYLERVWKEKIRIRPDFGDLVIQKVRADGRQDLDMFKTIKKVLMPLVEPGKIVTKGERKISFSEAKYLWYENALHWHAKETAPETKPMSMKDVESLTAIIGEMTVNTGNPLNPNGEIWFPFKSLILNKNKSYRQTYINSLLRFMKYEGGIDSIIGGTLKELRARPLSTLSSKQRAYVDAIESYFKIGENELNAASLSKKEFQQRLGSILGYLETKSTVPYKEGTYYSQYDMDIEFAKGKIDNAFYIKEKVRHDPYTKFRGVGRREGYWPHMDFNLKTLNREVLERFEEIKNSDLSGIEKIEIMESLTRRSTQLVSEGTIPDAGLNDAEANIILGKTLKGDSGLRQLELLGGNRTSGNLMSRKNNFGGYSYTFDVLGDYLWAMNRATYSNISSLLAENTIRSFVKDKPMGKYTQDWEYFMRMYVRDSMGAPSTATDEMLDSKTLKLRNTPWWWLSDQFLFEALPRTRKAFIKMKGLDKATDIQRELFDLKKQLGKVKEPNFERYWDKVKDTLYASRDAEGNIISQNIEFFSGRLRALAQAEGKWALASLLARAKVSVANVLGGGTNTWVYTGAKNIWRARDIGIWRDINPNTDEGAGPVFRSMADVYKWTHTLGVVDEMIMYEAGLMNREYKKGGLASFFNDAAKAIKNDPELKDATLMEIAKKHKVSDALFDKAAWFMRSSERQLRTRTFLASYLQARDSMYPVEFELNDPWLISQGKKGVKATQFFYHAPYRPAFARTSAGKVFNRFKLWSWNSGKFRREVYQEARYLGFKPGTKEFERLQRLVQADAFVIGLAMLLPYTMFDYSLPAPYSYMQNMADWAYGDEKQRERAYFGVLPKAIAPIHEIMPSILRGPEMIFGSLFTGSWDRLASYTLVSYVPFGLFGRDLIKAYQSPSMLTEFITGVPLHRIQRVKQDVEKGKKASPLTPTIW